MARRLIGATLVAAGLIFLAPASSAQPFQGCVYVWSPVASQICGQNPCGFCDAHEIWWQPVAEAYLCSNGAGGAAATACFQGTRWSNIQAWKETWRPVGAEGCNNPVSAVYDDCYTPPNPDQCSVPTNNKLQGLGDPVDLTTGGMERTDTDLDLGDGLDFTRHYSSESDPQYQNAMGKGWRHSLDWVLQYDEPQAAGTYNPSVEIAIVRRPLAPPVSFVRTTFSGSPSSDWKSGAFGAGSLEGDPSDALLYTDVDGTRVRFDRNGSAFDLVSVRPTGGAEIAVAQNGTTRTYTRGTSTVTLTLNAQSRVATASDGTATWTYSYDGAGCLLSAAGPNPAQPSQTVTWTYTPESVNAITGNCVVHRIKKISRQVGTGSTVTIGEWKYNQAKVISANEPGLDQTLCFGYGTLNETDVCATPATGVCSASLSDCGTTNPALATFSTSSGRIVSTTGDGGPGVDVAVAAATFTSASADAPGGFWRTKTDPNGAVTLYEDYDQRGRAARIVENWVDAEASGAGHGVVSAPDSYDRLREYTYHPTLDDPLTTTEASVLNSAGSHVVTNDYDSDLDSTPNEAPTDRLYRKIEQGWTLDAGGNQVAFTDTTEYGYDANGRLTSITGPRASEYTEIDYDATSGARSAVRRFLNGAASASLEWTFSSFDAHGNPQTVTDPNGRATAFTYDGLGRVLTAKPPCESGSCTGADDTTVTFTYDVDGNLTRVQFPDDSASADVFLELGYDAAKPDQLRFMKDSQGNAIVYTYTKGRVTAEARYTGFTSLASPGTKVGDASFSYTAAGRLFRAFNPLFGGGTVYSEFDHDAKGNPTAVQDENGKSDVLLYDALDRLTEIQQTRSVTYQTEFAYDALSNVTSVTDAGAKTTDLLHDDRGNLVETLSPDTGRTRFVYDAAGNLVQKIENAPTSGTSGARITSYAYDGLGRLTAIDLPNDADWTFTYDTSATVNQKGRLASVTNGVVETEFEYTRRGDVAVERTTIDGLAYEVAYEYDAAGNRKRIEAPSGAYAITSYAGLRPSSLAVTAGARTETVTNLAWYPFGPRIMAKLPPHDGTSNTVTSSRTVNLRGQITEVDVYRTGETFLDRSYTYDFTAGAPGPNDPGPNLDRVVDAVDASESRFYFYDELDRLQKATDLSGNVLHQYGYDAVGNRTSKIGPLGSSTYSYESGTDRLDAATGAEARDYHHDAFGDRDYDGATSYASTPSLIYDDANRLVTVKDAANGFATIATYTYDAFGRRVKKVADGKTILFFYDTEGHLIAEVEKVSSSANDLSRFYVFLEDELIGLVDDVGEVGAAAPIVLPRNLRRVPPPLVLLVLVGCAGIGVAIATRRVSPGLATTTSGAALLLLCAQSGGTAQFAWVHVDPLGTPLAATSSPASYAPAEAIWRASYEPFGKATVDEDPDGDTATFSLAVRFPGQYFDGESGLHFNFYRTYDPNTGRYLETDPLGLSGSSPYAYALGDPARFIDPLGLADMNLHTPGTSAWERASAIRTGLPVYSVAAHGTPEFVEDPQKNEIDPLGLADAIGRDPAWGGRPIALYACNTGNTRQGMEPFAQLLADALGVLVLAPDGFGWMPPLENPIRFRVGPIQGGECCEERMGLGSGCCIEILKRPHTDLKPDLGNPGRWRVFIPKQHQIAGPGY